MDEHSPVVQDIVKIEVWGGATLAGKQCLTNSHGSKGPHLGDPDPSDLPQRIGWGIEHALTLSWYK